MTQIYVDPEALDEFADALSRFRGAVLDEAGSIHSRLRRLGDTWTDQEYDRFVEEIEAVLRVLDAFSEEVDVAVPAIRRDAEDIRAYLALTR